MDLWEKSLYEMEEFIDGVGDFIQSSVEGNDYINLMHIFEHQNDMYFDVCHYTNKAHEIIAEKVYEMIMPIIKMYE